MYKKPVRTFVINHSNNYPVEDLLKCDFEHVIDQKRAPVISVNMYNFNFPALIDTGRNVLVIGTSRKNSGVSGYRC